jgi:hypothetical protein
MALSTLVGLVWVALVSVWARGWETTHSWLTWAIFVVGIAYIVLVLLEWLGFLSRDVIRAPHRRARPVVGPAPAANVDGTPTV